MYPPVTCALTASTPTSSDAVPSNSSAGHVLPSPSTSSLSSPPSSSPTAPSFASAPHHSSPAAAHRQLFSKPLKPPSSRRSVSQPPPTSYLGLPSPIPQFCSTSPPTPLSLSSSTASAKPATSRLHLIRILNTWSFDANSLSPLQTRCSLQILLSVYLKYTPGFIQQLKDLGVVNPEECLEGLVENLEAAYDPRNAYHNFRHAVDVVQAVYIILSHEGVVPPLGWVLEKESGVCEPPWQRQPVGRLGRLLDEMTIWGLLLAAAGHDVGHPGLSNAFMVNAKTPVAHAFSDGAVLENFHRITFTRMLREHGFGKMVDGHAGFRQVLVGAVLSTDMGRHFHIVEQLKRLASDWSKSPEDDSGTVIEELTQKVIITAGLIKCGDISNSAALETDLHLPVSVVTLHPAEKRAQAQSQVGFTSLFVLPLFAVMEQLSPIAFRPFADSCRRGLATWQEVVEQINSSGANLVMDTVPNSTPLQCPLSIDSIPPEQPVNATLQNLITRGFTV